MSIASIVSDDPIYIDDRAGSADLAPLLRARGLPVVLTRMDYGDVSWVGLGPGGEPVSVGVEVKGLHDVLKCICDGRFAGHQLPGLVQSYDQCWLLVEGLWRANSKTGILEYRHRKGLWCEASVGTRRFMYRDLATWLCTVEIKGGIKLVRVSDWNEATLWLSACHSWWTQKKEGQVGWEAHKSHLAFHDGTRHGAPHRTNPGRASGMVRGLSDQALLTRPTLCRLVAAQLPGVGWKKSEGLARRFQTVEALTVAEISELKEVEGIGPKLAQGIYDSVRSRR